MRKRCFAPDSAVRQCRPGVPASDRSPTARKTECMKDVQKSCSGKPRRGAFAARYRLVCRPEWLCAFPRLSPLDHTSSCELRFAIPSIHSPSVYPNPVVGPSLTVHGFTVSAETRDRLSRHSVRWLSKHMCRQFQNDPFDPDIFRRATGSVRVNQIPGLSVILNDRGASPFSSSGIGSACLSSNQPI